MNSPNNLISRAPGVIENDVLVGHQDTLFLAGGAHTVLDIVEGVRAIAPHSFANFSSNVEARAAWAAQNGAAYLHLIFPDKQSIVPERWPAGPPLRLGQNFIEKASSLLPLVYPVELLAEHASRAVSLIDTHVTDHGSIVVAGHLVERLVGASQSAVVNRLLTTIDASDERSGDLGSKLTPPVSVKQPFSTVRAPGRWLHNNLSGGNNGMVDLRFNGAPTYDKRVVIFGDSFGREIGRFLQFWFREVLFFRSGFFHPDLASLCSPDYLITENVERYLDDIRDDDERPNFLMYPYLREEAYAPSVEFAAAFSALLSVPRKPYIDFCRDEFGERGWWKSGGEAVRKASIEPFKSLGVIALAVPDGGASDVACVEPVRIVPRHMPVFTDNLSGRDLEPWLSSSQDIHGTFLVKRSNVLLLGPSIQVTDAGRWACESRAFAEQFVEMVAGEGYKNIYPGPKPTIEHSNGHYRLDLRAMIDDTDLMSEPLFLGTPLEPNNWGRWIATVVPKVSDFQQFGDGRGFFCYADLPWQRNLLRYLGLADEQIVKHSPGRTYLCADLMSAEYSITNMTISQRERDIFAAISARARRRERDGQIKRPCGERIFVSRLSASVKHPHYRVLQNERELAHRLQALGFEVIEPEALSFDEQILAFSGAKLIVALGGAAIYNSVFCGTDSSYVTIESSSFFLKPHCDLLSSLELRYGVIVGKQDLTDPSPVHKRWTVDVDAVCQRIIQFGAAA